jgi:FkbM family methyltransferase
MVTSVGLIRTLTTTKEPHNAILLKLCNSRKLITFRNGSKLRLTWSQFRFLRDNYVALQQYPIKQIGDELFKARFGSFDLVAPLPMLCCVATLSQKYTIERVDDDLFQIKGRKFDLVGSSCLLNTVWEIERGEYDCDCRNKVVLDVGSFQGETAVFFALGGAKKVILYEPVKAHHSLIRRNVLANDVNAEIHACGIGDSDGIQVINYNRADVTFGPLSQGRFKMKIQVKNVADVLAESEADVAKFDCEGAEESLINVPSEILRRISFYLFELHGSRTIKAVVAKFKTAGFGVAKIRIGNPERVNISFRRKEIK